MIIFLLSVTQMLFWRHFGMQNKLWQDWKFASMREYNFAYPLNTNYDIQS